jgi:hypothetical protein
LRWKGPGFIQLRTEGRLDRIAGSLALCFSSSFGQRRRWRENLHAANLDDLYDNTAHGWLQRLHAICGFHRTRKMGMMSQPADENSHRLLSDRVLDPGLQACQWGTSIFRGVAA